MQAPVVSFFAAALARVVPLGAEFAAYVDQLRDLLAASRGPTAQAKDLKSELEWRH
ncbi:hypothetical protein [Phenylobacterium sp.]|uniref:hypothetical protein n=1 Tax=Phenylobacterium sp. TaxID=1871053 RepID=UPI0025E95C75|nr:hypothetical protein [Phenylobacterium sp.]